MVELLRLDREHDPVVKEHGLVAEGATVDLSCPLINIDCVFRAFATVSDKNFSRQVCFLAVVSSTLEKPSCLPPTKPDLPSNHRAIVAWIVGVPQSLLGKYMCI